MVLHKINIGETCELSSSNTTRVDEFLHLKDQFKAIKYNFMYFLYLKPRIL